MAMKTKIRTPDGTELGERSKALKLEAASITTHSEAKARSPELLIEALKLIEGYENVFVWIQKALDEDPDIDYSAGQEVH